MNNTADKTARIAVIGSCNVDVVTFYKRFPKAGETVMGERFDMGFGGKGANQAVAARLCGADVQMVARVGDDLFGPATVANFERLGIDAREVRVLPGQSSGVAPIFVDPNGQNSIFVVAGANLALTPADVETVLPQLAGARCLVLQLEIALETVYAAVQHARARGIRCILNPAPAQALDLARLRGLDYFIPNESEAQALTGLPVGTLAETEACARALVAAGLSRVILTLGERGAMLAHERGCEHIPAFPVETVDTTGAGDAFIGSFATFLDEGLPERAAIARANLYAALSTTKVGTQKSFASRTEFEREWQKRL
jgi:ribokinase